jgi:hypothetical protein
MFDHSAKQKIQCSIFTIQVLVLFGAFKSMCEEIIVPIDVFSIHLDGLEDNDGSKSHPATNDGNQEKDGDEFIIFEASEQGIQSCISLFESSC